MSPVRLLLALALSIGGATTLAAQSPPPCQAEPAFRALDFWVGSWQVLVGDSVVGHNRISRILNGCAIREEWTAAGGGTGESLFYYLPAERLWKQVWVTENAVRPGGVKEKRLVARLAAGALRFQGEVRGTDGSVWLDRTTLTPLPGGEVRQLIEISTDGGASWRATFDAVYRRHP